MWSEAEAKPECQRNSGNGGALVSSRGRSVGGRQGENTRGHFNPSCAQDDVQNDSVAHHSATYVISNEQDYCI